MNSLFEQGEIVALGSGDWRYDRDSFRYAGNTSERLGIGEWGVGTADRLLPQETGRAGGITIAS